jgi:hypothetical protein
MGRIEALGDGGQLSHWRGVDLLGLGIVGLASIGFPLVCAGVLAVISAGRD